MYTIIYHTVEDSNTIIVETNKLNLIVTISEILATFNVRNLQLVAHNC